MWIVWRFTIPPFRRLIMPSLRRRRLPRAARPLLVLALVTLAGSPLPLAAQVIRSASGASAADASVNAGISAFETDLGAARRRIRWDGVPDARSAPNAMPANQFQGAGNLYSTPGTHLQVSANAAAGPIEFDNIDPSYSSIFAPFSTQKLFTSIGSNVIDVHFVRAGTTTPGVTNGFGVMFSDVDLANTTSIELFTFGGTSLGKFFAPAIAGNETFSFLGISYATPIIGRARITQGDVALAAGVLDGTNGDLVVTDDFFFGEVAAVPEPSTVVLVAGGLVALAAAARRRAVAPRA
jgi:hypothetical protein